MSVAVRERPAEPAVRHDAAPARRAMVRWAWRMFRREWRRQALVLVLLMVAVAATIVGLGAVSNLSQLKADPTFGTANTILILPGSDPRLAADIAAIRSRFGAIDVIAHQNIPIPGSVSSVDLRAESPGGPYGDVTLRLDSGRYPTGAGQVAVTEDVAKAFGLHLGGIWTEGGQSRQVVGIVENPLNLLDQFALVAPGQANPPAQISILVNSNQQTLQSLNLPSGTGLNVSSRGTASKTAAEAIVLVLGSLGLLFVGLMAVAGFTVIAQRRLRALGMLGALGATDRHIRLVMLANGAAVGATAAVTGLAIGLAGWFAFAPTLQSISEQRVDPLALPWWAIGAALLLTFVTAVAAAWWPARQVARIPAVAALSGRPPRPQPAHRFAALGSILLGAGLVMLAFADQRRAGLIIGGTVTTAVGLLLLAPLAIKALAAAGRRWPVSVRLAVRDLSRYQARSGAALGAVTFAIGIAATIAISAAAAQAPTGPGNLPTDQLMLYLSPAGPASQIPPINASQQQSLNTAVNRIAAGVGAASVVPLDEAYDPNTAIQPSQPGGPGGEQPAGYATTSLAKITATPQGTQVTAITTLYVATPALLSYYGIHDDQIGPNRDLISSRSDVAGFQIFNPGAGPGPSSNRPTRPPEATHPTIQTFHQLPQYTSDPQTLITDQAMRALGLRPIPSGWLVQAPHNLTSSQIAAARHTAAAAGLYVETRQAQKSLAPLRNWSTAAGILLALGVLAVTVGLIRSETANDLRTLTATGASSTTRRTLTGATAGALALLGALLGTAGAYAALLAWHRSDLGPLARVPAVNLVLLIIGLPAIATVAGWLLAGREPPAINRRPLE